jgi:tetratricopeptide (TPR) repeat protein
LLSSALLSSGIALAAAPGEDCLAHHAAEQFEEAIRCYQDLQKASGDSMPWAYLEGDAQLSLFRDPSAAWRRAGEYLPARIRLAEWFLQNQLPAADLVSALVRQSPGSARVQYLAGKALNDTQAFKKAVELEPRFGQAHYELALALRRAGQPTEAAEHFKLFQRFAKVSVELDDPILARVKALARSPFDLVLAGRRAQEASRFEEAEKHYLAALEANPNLVQAHVNLIAIRAQLGKPAEAEASFHKAVAIDPAIPESYYNYGLLLFAAQAKEAAEAQFLQAIQRNPHYADALNNLGSLLLARGASQQAEERFRQALSAQPKHADANFNLGRLLGLARREGAAEYFSAAVAVESERTPAHLYYFALYLQSVKQRVEAVAKLELAVKLAQTYGQKDLATYLSDLLRQWQPNP